MRIGWTKRGLATAGALALAIGLTACAESERDSGDGSGGDGGSTFIFAGASDPVMLDPALASDGETFRVSRQIFEGLVTTEGDSTELAPALATEWESSEDGLTHSFTLREGVKFHDGTDFNAEAVCANFDRWHNWTGLNQNENISYYYNKMFRGFANPEEGKDNGIYDSCTADSPTEATIQLNDPFAAFVAAMTLPAFSMQSPTALEQYDADNTTGTVDDTRFSPYATEHPTGTGPFTFESWERDQQVTLKANPDYWGEPAKSETVIIRSISDPNARRQELQAGNIDGYDLVAPGDVQPLQDEGLQVLNRPAFNILYLNFNQKTEALQDERVRQAINYAIDKDAVISQSLPPGSEPAIEFMPSMVNGYNPDVTSYDYDPERAKELLAEAGQENLTLRFAYPTGVSRPYMPTPEATFVAVSAQLEAVGITVEPVTADWSQYLDMMQTEEGADQRDIGFLGWTGDYDDPDNFVGTFFGAESYEWGFDNPELFDALSDARQLPNVEEQASAYSEINEQIAQFAPGVPLSHPAPSLAFSQNVQGYVPSPFGSEAFTGVSVS